MSTVTDVEKREVAAVTGFVRTGSIEDTGCEIAVYWTVEDVVAVVNREFR